MSSSAAFFCTACQTASIASATTASSPMAGAATTSLAAGIYWPRSQLMLEGRQLTATAISSSTPVTSPSAPNVVAPCGGSLSYRAPPAIGRFAATHHDIDTVARNRSVRVQDCCPSRRHASTYADPPPQSRQQSVSAHQIEVLLTCRARLPRLLPPKKCSSPARHPTSCKDCQRAANTIPIAPKHPRLRSIRLQ